MSFQNMSTLDFWLNFSSFPFKLTVVSLDSLHHKKQAKEPKMESFIYKTYFSSLNGYICQGSLLHWGSSLPYPSLFPVMCVMCAMCLMLAVSQALLFL